MLNKYDYEKLIDDIKLISKSVKVVADENDQSKRQYALGLSQNLVDRLYRDICEMKEKTESNGQTYGGNINEV